MEIDTVIYWYLHIYMLSISKFIIRYWLMWLCRQKCPDLLSASWRPRRAGGVVWRPKSLRGYWCRFHWGSEGLTTRDAEGRRDGCPNSSSQPERANPIFLHLFVLFKSLAHCVMPTYLGQAICFTQSTNPDANLFQEPPHRHIQK